ncbi:MAG TPA: mechanosensitive ion channel family protein [Vicinamibacterales bacterium]
MLRVLTILWLACGGGAPAAFAQGAPADEDPALDTAVVELDGAPLFRVRGTSSYPAATRASVITGRLVAVAKDHSIQTDAIQVTAGSIGPQIVAGDRLIMPVIQAEADLERVSLQELAAAHVLRIREAVAAYRLARTPAALRAATVATVAASIVFLFATGVVLWLWRRVDARVMRHVQARVHTVGIQSFEVMRAEQIWKAVRSAVSGIRTLVVLALALVYLGYVLARWPWTRGLSRDMTAFVLAPVQVIGGAVVAHIPSLIFLAVLYVVFRFGLRVMRLFFDAVAQGTVSLDNFEPEWAEPTYKILRLAVVAFGLIVAYPYIPGSESAAFKGVSIFIGIVFSLGSSSAISNVIAGYMMTYRRAFKVGDVIKIAGHIGEVLTMRLQVTHLRSAKNEEVVVPNSQILSNEVVNYSTLARQRGLLLHTEVGIGYETPWRQVEAMLLEAAARTPDLAPEPKPFVLVRRLGDFAVVYELNVGLTEARRMLEAYTALHLRILDVFNEYGVQIMTPAYMADPIQPKLVPPDQWYTAPAAPPRQASTV